MIWRRDFYENSNHAARVACAAELHTFASSASKVLDVVRSPDVLSAAVFVPATRVCADV